MTSGVLIFCSSKLRRVLPNWRHRTIEVCALSIGLFGLNNAEKPPGRMRVKGLTGRKVLLKSPMLNIQARSGRRDSCFWVKLIRVRVTSRGNQIVLSCHLQYCACEPHGALGG